MEKIIIEWNGIVLMEPVVFLTNWLITFQCFYYWQKSSNGTDSTSVKYWRNFFLLFGLSTFFGGLSHLYFHYFDMIGKIPGWSLAVLSITYLELAVFNHNEKNPQWKKWVWVQTVIIFIMLAFDFRFLWVTAQTVIGLVLILGIYSVLQIRQGDKKWIGFMIGIGWMLVSVPVVIVGFDPAIWFNRQDISHLFMMLCLFQFFKTTKTIN